MGYFAFVFLVSVVWVYFCVVRYILLGCGLNLCWVLLWGVCGFAGFMVALVLLVGCGFRWHYVVGFIEFGL